MAKATRQLAGTPCLDFINTPDPEIPTDPPRHRRAVRRFRATLRRLLEAEARGLGAGAEEMATLNRVLAAAGSSRGLVSTVRGYGWGWLDYRDPVERLLWPAAFSAARLLEGPDLVRLKACDSCGRLFLDASRNRSRRWCDMEGCGNREKQRRHRRLAG